MARGCVPVVSEMESGIPDVITNEQNGLIVTGRNYDEWARLIVDLWRDKARLALMSQQARETVCECFTVERVGKQFDELFRRVAEEMRTGEYQRPPALHWGYRHSSTGDVLPPPNICMHSI